MLEGDNDAADMVTFQSIDVETPAGHIKKCVKVPLPPVSKGHGISIPSPLGITHIDNNMSQLHLDQSQDADVIADFGADADEDAGASAATGDQINKVNMLLVLN